jgi:hypothetical protein
MKKSIKSAVSPAPATPPAAAPKSAPKSVNAAPKTTGEAPKITSASRPMTPAPAPAPRVETNRNPGAATPSPAKASAPAQAFASAAASAPARPDAVTAVPTVIAAQVDVGFGNALYIRGEGPGLSWEKGVLLENTSSDHWKISISKATKPVTFKFLVNDEKWSSGEDYVVKAGAEAIFTPFF